MTLFLNWELLSRCFLHYILHAIIFPTPFEACVLQLKASRCYCMGLFGDISGFLFSTLSTFHSGHLHSTCIYLYPVAKLLFTVSRLTTCVLVLKCEQLQGFLIYYLHIISIPDPIFGSWCFFYSLWSRAFLWVFFSSGDFWFLFIWVCFSFIVTLCMHLSLLSMFFFFQCCGFYWAWFYFKRVWAISSCFSLHYSSFPSPE